MLDPTAKFDPLGNLVVRFGAGMFNHPHGPMESPRPVLRRPSRRHQTMGRGRRRR
jgi:hypothetical protein